MERGLNLINASTGLALEALNTRGFFIILLFVCFIYF